jgi:hypothetical protein
VESWPGYTERAAQLVERIWPQRKLPYAVLSAVAHAELLGMTRSLGPLASQAAGRSAPASPDDALWLWQDAYLVLGALVFSADRAAGFLGLHDDLAAVHNLAERLDKRLPALRPAIPGNSQRQQGGRFCPCPRLVFRESGCCGTVKQSG